MIKPHRRSPLDTQVLLFDDLKRLSGKSQLATVERWAKSQGIRYGFDSRGGMWTTVDALNVALGVSAEEQPSALYGGELID